MEATGDRRQGRSLHGVDEGCGMKYLPLIWAGLRRKPARTTLTFLSIVVAFLLFGILQGMTAGFDRSISQLSDARLRITSKTSSAEALPIAHLRRIEEVAGVKAVAHFSHFGGYWREPRFRMPGGAVDIERMLAVFPELLITEEHIQAMRRNRAGMLIGRELAEITGWQVGDRVPVSSGIWMRRDGSNVWELEIVGIYDVSDTRLRTNEFWINYEYFDEARSRQSGTVTLFVAALEDSSLAAQVAQEIDALFANSAHETLTQNEKDWMRSRLDAIGDIGYVVNAVSSAVVFTLLTLIGNTLVQSVRERVR